MVDQKPLLRFNTQPPEGGWKDTHRIYVSGKVSTHSRLKAAGEGEIMSFKLYDVSTHSRLKAAGDFVHNYQIYDLFQHTAA